MKTLEVFLGIQLLLVISFVCADDEPPACPELACDKQCPYGLAVGVTGCPTCECRDEVCQAQAVTCSLGKICKKFHLTNTETDISKCVDPTMPERCQLPMDAGKCRANQIQWFYDSDTNQCQEFGYGGCPGNDNRFETKEACDVGCKTSCGDVMCMMYCENGNKKDSRGCDICVCEEDDPVILPIESADKTFAVGLGCDENEEVSCDLHCPLGFERDQYDCEICKCKVPSTCNTEPCSTECLFGFRTDNDGCPTCQCREEGECNEFVCEMFCEFGLKKDKNNCNRCECNLNPCTTHACPKETYCDLRGSTGANITCLMQWSVDCPSVSCMLYCENGFKSDIYGCPVCDCLETPKKSCPEFMCQRVCDFGFQKDQFACDVCKCLPDPCQDKTCNNDEVCETVNDCIETVCSHSAKCSENDSIKRVRVHMSFSHKKPLDPELMDEFLQKMKESFAGILKVDESQITDMKAKQDNKTVHVTFHVVGAGDENLVKTWKMAETHLMTKSTESAITYAGQDFVPQHDSLVSLYSSNEEPEDKEGGGNATLTIVIACAVVGVIILVVAGIVSMYYSKSKKEKKRNNVIYKQAPGASTETEYI